MKPINTQLRAKSLDDLSGIAKAFFRQNPKPSVVLLNGPMGAGKTTFVKALCRELGSENNISSPTFALVNEYLDRDDRSIYHFDLYRIEEPDEVLDFGIEEYLDSGNWCFVEWPDRASKYLPDDVQSIEIKIEGDDRVFHF